MSLKHVARIVEGKLYAWGMMRLEYPDAPISRVYREEIPGGSGFRSNQQEAWALRHQDALRDAAVIEKAMRGMSDEQRRLVELRYVDRWPWRKVAERLHVSERTVYGLRQQVVIILAYEFGLTGGDSRTRTS